MLETGRAIPMFVGRPFGDTPKRSSSHVTDYDGTARYQVLFHLFLAGGR
jgi:hypothetical protein